MSDIKILLGHVQADIEKIDEIMRADLDRLAANMDQHLLDVLHYGLFGGGKRFRPLLAVISGRLCGSLDENAYRLAVAFEYLHMATLLHDDVIDQAAIRRGRPSVVSAYGITAAILGGDFLHALSMELIGRYGGTAALCIFCEATRAMVDGEFIQLRNSNRYNQSEDDYFKAIEGKTAVLISAATEIGALCGGGDPRQQLALKEYGRNLGFGFQIIDDLLDYQGDAEFTGKAVGNDLAEGKMTLPLILAMEQADDRQRQHIHALLADTDRRRSSFKTVYSFIEENEGFVRAHRRASQRILRAQEHLTLFSAGEEKDVEILTGLAEYALYRNK
ncbi:MAG TPA: polyprenyl synthetase family protein [Desulfopila sp.]|nr:polyprenyl synthetase family protein [Desulfopila sp.]